MFINDSYVDNIKTKDLVDLGQSIQGVAAGRDHVRHRADRGIHRRVRQRAARARTTCGRCSTRSSTTTRCPRRRTPTTPRCPARRSRRRADARRRPTSQRRHRPPTGDRAGRTRSPPTRRTSPCRSRTRPARTGWPPPQPAELQQHGFNVDDARRLPGLAELDDGVLLARQRTGRRHGRLGVRRTRRSSGSPAWATSCRWCSGSDFSSVDAPVAQRLAGAGARRCAAPAALRPQLPEDLTVTNAADTTCE